MEKDIDTYLYDTNGKLIEEEVTVRICAKHRISKHSGAEGFYIKWSNKGYYDPRVLSPTYYNANWKFIKVTAYQFSLYIRFLKTKQERFLTEITRQI